MTKGVLYLREHYRRNKLTDYLLVGWMYEKEVERSTRTYTLRLD